MIKTWQERCDEHPDHQTGMVSDTMIMARMQEEIDDLRAALTEQEQEPVAWMLIDSVGDEDDIYYAEPVQAELPEGWSYKPLYTHPVRREWVGLTKEELTEITDNLPYDVGNADIQVIETKIKEKNQ
jgi:hypothetical protein